MRQLLRTARDLKTPYARALIKTAIVVSGLLGWTAYAEESLENRVDDLEYQGMINNAMTEPAAAPAATSEKSKYNYFTDTSIPEWQRTGCATHVVVDDKGRPWSVCD